MIRWRFSEWRRLRANARWLRVQERERDKLRAELLAEALRRYERHAGPEVSQ